MLYADRASALSHLPLQGTVAEVGVDARVELLSPVLGELRRLDPYLGLIPDGSHGVPHAAADLQPSAELDELQRPVSSTSG